MSASPSRRNLYGSLFWVLNIQYFIVQVVVGLAFRNGYSIANNTISDLGNTACANYSGRLVCSPDHSLMNASFILLSLTIIAGAVLLQKSYRRNRLAGAAFACMILSGIGGGVVGLFPENTISGFHIAGAGLVFVLGNLSLLLFGVSLQLPRWFRIYSVASGGLGLITLGLFVTNSYLGLGSGGMERLTAYPQTIWMIVYGLYSLKRRPVTD